MKETKNINTTIYQETVEDLRTEIESNYGTIDHFSSQTKIDKFNLYRIFSKSNKKEMSVGLFSRIMTALGYEGLESAHGSNLSLKKYLEIDNNALLKAILLIKFS